MITGLLLPADLTAELVTLYATVGACAILLTGIAHFFPAIAAKALPSGLDLQARKLR